MPLQMQLPLKQTMKTHEVGLLLNRTPKTIRSWIHEGKLKAVKTPTGQWLIPTINVTLCLRLSSECYQEDTI